MLHSHILRFYVCFRQAIKTESKLSQQPTTLSRIFIFFFVFSGNFRLSTCVRLHTDEETNICCSDYIGNAALLNTKTTKICEKKKHLRLLVLFFCANLHRARKNCWMKKSREIIFLRELTSTKKETKREWNELLMYLFVSFQNVSKVYKSSWMC